MRRLLPLLLFLLAACASGEELGTRVDEMWLATKVRSRLASGSFASFRTMDVQAQGGTIVLTGYVATEEEKARVEEMVRPLRGVESIRNELVVGEAPPAPAAPRRSAPPNAEAERPGTTFGGSGR